MTAGDLGLIWRVTPGKMLATVIDEALAHHVKKFGQPANIVDVHPEVLSQQFVVKEGVEIREDRSRLKNEIFVGRKVGT